MLHSLLTQILCLLIGVAGVYYLFYSRAAHRLSILEGDTANRQRILLRRTNGVALIFLSILLYIGTSGIDARESPRVFLAFLLDWIGVLCLLLIIVVLALVDVRQTIHLRQRRKSGKATGD